jgi:hypothetical protein
MTLFRQTLGVRKTHMSVSLSVPRPLIRMGASVPYFAKPS